MKLWQFALLLTHIVIAPHIYRWASIAIALAWLVVALGHGFLQ